MIDFKEYVKENKMLFNEYVYGKFLIRFANVEQGSNEYWKLKRIFEDKELYLKGNSPEEKRKFIEEHLGV